MLKVNGKDEWNLYYLDCESMDVLYACFCYRNGKPDQAAEFFGLEDGPELKALIETELNYRLYALLRQNFGAITPPERPPDWAFGGEDVFNDMLEIASLDRADSKYSPVEVYDAIKEKL